MSDLEFKRLKTGDCIQNEGSGCCYTVIDVDNHCKTVTAIRHIVASNPFEWKKIATLQREEK